MPTYRSAPDFEHGKSESIGVLVVNLGTPTEPTPSAVRRFLKQFLSDRRVIEYPRLLWWLILRLVILVIRPRRSAAAYRKIWTENGSPLMLYSRAIVDKLVAQLAATSEQPIHVELAMTYGEPSIGSALENLLLKGSRKVVTLPLYPQYSGTTTAAVSDALADVTRNIRWIPESRFINDYHDAPGYISALAESVRESWSANGRGDKLLLSFHGVPKSTLTKGDPYHCQCHKTARLLAEELKLKSDEWLLSFQSRVGRDEWLSPYTDATVKELAKDGVSRLDVVCPGFATDCLETLEEIAIQNAEFFTGAGGDSLHYIPSLNARDDHVQFLAKLVLRHCSGWNVNNDTSHRQATRERALAKGAER